MGGLYRRHSYICAGETISWQSEWYTQAWFTESRASYDRAASTGPVSPPVSIIQTVPACVEALSEAGSSVTVSVSVTSGMSGSVMATTTSGMATATSGMATATSGMVTMTSGIMSGAGGSATASATSSTPTASATAASAAASAANTCAGNWDYQGWSIVASLGAGILVGGLIWLLWAILRDRFPSIYSPRASFVQDRPWSIFLLPFLNLPSMSSTPLSEGHLGLHAMFAALKLAGIASLLALAAGLPLFVAGVPCISNTAPSNPLGGRLGTLTDLSLLRLLDALDPSPESTATLFQLQIRDLPSTIAPAIGSAQTRLIVLLVIMAVLGCGLGLFVIARTYGAFDRYARQLTESCGGIDMVIIPDIPAWRGLSETKVKKWFKEVDVPGVKDIDVVGLFAIPDTSEWSAKLAERDLVLNRLEEAEAAYISSFRLVPTSSGRRIEAQAETRYDFVAPKDYYKVSTGRKSSSQLNVPTPTSLNGQSKFKEINRNSAMFKRFSIGQRIKVDEHGQYVPDPSPTSEHTDPISPATSEVVLQPGPSRQVQLQPPPDASQSQRPSHEETSPLGHQYNDVKEFRTRLKALNVEVEQCQQKAFGQVAQGRVKGWMVVGKNMRFLPFAQVVEGRTKEDVLWNNVGRQSGEMWFWIKIGCIGLVLAAIIIPFVGLTVASAPGFAHYLGFLKPLQGNGFGAGFVEGFVPALVMALVGGLAVTATNHFARGVRVVSRVQQRVLAYKATFYLLLFSALFWILVTVLEYAVQGFAIDVQKARAVGDGAVFSTWSIFIILLNLAIIVPGLYILQPRRLMHYRTKLTPRQKFRQSLPPSFNPSFAFLPFLLAVFYASSLIFIFPLLAIPIVLLTFLSLVANRHMVDNVFSERTGYNSLIGSWTLRRFGWVLGVQPWLFGLILLSRREWGLGGAGMGVAGVTVVLSECLIKRLTRSKSKHDNLERLRKEMQTSRDVEVSDTTSHHRVSDSSMLQRLAALLPGYSRLPEGCPLPLATEDVDDLFYTERASYVGQSQPLGQLIHDPSETIRGLLYPPELLAPVPVIWLPNDPSGVALTEATDLDAYHGLPAIVHPQ